MELKTKLKSCKKSEDFKFISKPLSVPLYLTSVELQHLCFSPHSLTKRENYDMYHLFCPHSISNRNTNASSIIKLVQKGVSKNEKQ